MKPMFNWMHAHLASTLNGDRLFSEYYFSAVSEYTQRENCLPLKYEDLRLKELATLNLPRRERQIEFIALMQQMESPRETKMTEQYDEILKEPLAQDSFDLIDRCIEADHLDARLLVLRGRMYFSKKCYGEAATDFYHASLMAPGNVAIKTMKAMAQALSGDYEGAKTEVEKLAKIKAEDRRTLTVRGILSYKLKRDAEAISVCNQAMMLPGDSSEALRVLVAANHRLGKNSQAFEALKLLLEDIYQIDDFYLQEALAYQLLSNTKRANWFLSKATGA